MPRFKWLESKIFIKLMSYDKKFREAQSLSSFIEKYCDTGTKLVGYNGPRGMLTEISFNEIPTLFNHEKGKSTHKFMFSNPEHSLTIRTEDSDYVESFGELDRIEIHCSIPVENLSIGYTLFHSLIMLTNPYWGEMNIESVTDRPSFSGVNEHKSCFPKFGSFNYLGKSYLDFFTREVLENIGFDKIESLDNGIITHISAENNDEFSQKQNKLCQQLEHLKIFEDYGVKYDNIFKDLGEHVKGFANDIPPMEFRITSSGLKKKLL